MTIYDVKEKMMKLWIDIFGDSEEYVKLLFSTYFNDEWIEYEEDNGDIVASLVAIPYKFSGFKGYGCDISDKSKDRLFVDKVPGDSISIDAIYLCGLCTLPEYRGIGIMSKLMNKISHRAYVNNIGFIFLIPADMSLRCFYRRRGYVNSCYNIINEYASGYSYMKLYDDPLSIKYSKNNSNYNIVKFGFIDDNDVPIVLDKMCHYLNNKCGSVLSIYRSKVDVLTILRENQLSGGYIFISHDESHDINGILFTTAIINDNVRVQLIMYDNDDIKYHLLGTLQSEVGSTVSITCVEVSPALDFEIASEFNQSNCSSSAKKFFPAYVGAAREDANLSSFGMSKIIRPAEILKYATSLYPDRKYSILITEDDFAGNCGLYEVGDCSMRFTPIDKLGKSFIMEFISSVSEHQNHYHLSVPELSAIIWRHAVDVDVEAVMQIPALPINFALMLE